MTLALALVAGIIGVIELVKSKATSLIAWAILALSLALVWPVSRLVE